MIVLSTVRLVARGASLLESWLVVIRLLPRIGNIAVAAQADIDRIGLGQSWLPAGMWTMAVGAIARRSRMRNFRRVDQFGFLVVAGHAERLGVGLRQYYFSILGRRMADFTLLVGKRWMRELRHQLRRRRLVRIVTAQAIGRSEGLILVRLHKGRILGIVAIKAERWSSLGQMESVFNREVGPRLMRNVAGLASHVERGMAAPLFGNV